MFYHNVLLLSSCCASSNTYTREESALAFPPPLLSHSCVLLIFFFFFFVFWSGVLEDLFGVFLQGLENHRRGENCSRSFIGSPPGGAPAGTLGPAPSPLPPRCAGSLAAVQAAASLRPNFQGRNSAPCRQPDNAALTLIEIFSLVMLEHQSNQQRSRRI